MKVIDRIKKLLRKAENTKNDNEKMLFYRKAQELIIINDIDENELKLYEHSTINEIYSEYFDKNMKDWYWKLADVIAHNHNCLYFQSKPQTLRGFSFCFIGENDKPTIASYTINSLLILLYKKSVSYRLEFIDGLRVEYEKNWSKYELVPVVPTTVEEYIEKFDFEKAEQKSRQEVTNASDYSKGFIDGGRYTENKIDIAEKSLRIG